MQITLLGSLGNINRIVVPALVQMGHQITVITSTPQRVAAIKALGATPAVGDMGDVVFLTRQFQDQDVVYLMISGTANDLFAAAETQAQVFATAVTEAQVHRVVNLSSIGAQTPEAGSLYAYHFIEDALSQLDADVAFVRPVGFYNNLFASLETVKAQKAIYANIPAETIRKYVAPQDIASVVIQLLDHTPAGKTIRYVVSDTFTGTELVESLGAAIGEAVAYVEITDAQYAANLRRAGVPESIITPFVKSTQLQKQPDLMYADLANQPVITGQVNLADFAKNFHQALTASNAPTAHTVVDR